MPNSFFNNDHLNLSFSNEGERFLQTKITWNQRSRNYGFSLLCTYKRRLL